MCILRSLFYLLHNGKYHCASDLRTGWDSTKQLNLLLILMKSNLLNPNLSNIRSAIQTNCLDSQSNPVICFLKWPLFLYCRLFNTFDSECSIWIYCLWLDSNRGPLEFEATAQPTEPQPLPSSGDLLNHQLPPIFQVRTYWRVEIRQRRDDV